MFCTKEHKTSKKDKRCLCVVDFFSGYDLVN
eukprot:UN12241